MIASALLHRFLHQQIGNLDNSSDYRGSDYESRFRDDQLLMFLGDPGRTDKIRVIDAMNAFRSSWYRSNTIVKTALTGKATTLIGSCTLASFVVRLEHSIKEKQFTLLDLLVIDEVSMMSKCEWLKLTQLLRRYMQIENVPFGGISVVLVGDLLQMPPVKSDPFYIDAANKAKAEQCRPRRLRPVEKNKYLRHPGGVHTLLQRHRVG
jgi:hypothetical protein